MSYQPRHRNPMVALHGPGPDGTLCRHCDHIDSDLHGKESKFNRFFCKIAIGDSIEVEEEGHPSLQGYIPAIHKIARQNPKLYLANYQKYNHRITWPSCSLFSGQATITYLCKGTCGKEYTIARTGHDSRKFTGYCQSCAEISHREKRELAREMAEKMLPRYERRDDRGNEGAGKKVGEKNGGDVKVCFPVKAKEGTKRHKCLGNSIAEECPSYSACINYACNMGWSGFRDCGEEGKGRR